MKIEQLEKNDIVILGFGREGQDTYAFLRKNFPDKELIIADKRGIDGFDDKVRGRLSKDKAVKLFLGENYLDSLVPGRVVIKTPGISLSSIADRVKDCVVTSQTELFFDNCPAKIIGVTGTKGKSTTSSLIHALLKNDGRMSYLLGNIEKPSLSYLPKIKEDDWIVYELSCHQLQTLHTSPHIAIFLNLYPEHLDYYEDMDEYFLAKANIFLHQKKGDYLIHGEDVPQIAQYEGKIAPEVIQVKRMDHIGFLNTYRNMVCRVTHDDNIMIFLELAKILGIGEEVVMRTLKKFKKLPHRLEYVGEYRGIRFYDDSIATIPESVIYALDTLDDRVETLIVGGLNRGIEFNKLGERIAISKIKNLVLFPDSGKDIKEEVLKYSRNHDIVFHEAKDMEDAIRFVFENTQEGKICLLSPASPSFNMFKDYKERGDMYKKIVKELGNEEKD
jgi:UDP-N-acetylmuramoylalanine--D-glutamate ligase